MTNGWLHLCYCSSHNGVQDIDRKPIVYVIFHEAVLQQHLSQSEMMSRVIPNTWHWHMPLHEQYAMKLHRLVKRVCSPLLH